MNLNRRQFLYLTVGVAAGCESATDDRSQKTPQATRVVNAGPINNYAKDGVYANFRDQGFFVIRRGEKLFALSSFCTHRKCRLDAEPDQTFYCKCHGSTFDQTGHVTKEPATRDLPTLLTSVSEPGDLFVTVPAW